MYVCMQCYDIINKHAKRQQEPQEIKLVKKLTILSCHAYAWCLIFVLSAIKYILNSKHFWHDSAYIDLVKKNLVPLAPGLSATIFF